MAKKQKNPPQNKGYKSFLALLPMCYNSSMNCTTTQTLYVHVAATAPLEQLDSDDAGIAGIYRVELRPGAPSSALANAALDGFHSQIPIAVLDDFEIAVCEGIEDDSPEIEQDFDHDSYTLTEFATSVVAVMIRASIR